MPGADSDGSPLLPPQRSDILLSFPFLLKKKGGGKERKKKDRGKKGRREEEESLLKTDKIKTTQQNHAF